jgi:hypothetical protein
MNEREETKPTNIGPENPTKKSNNLCFEALSDTI